MTVVAQAEFSPAEVFDNTALTHSARLHAALTLGLSQLVESTAGAGELGASEMHAQILGRYILARREHTSNARAFFDALASCEDEATA